MTLAPCFSLRLQLWLQECPGGAWCETLRLCLEGNFQLGCGGERSPGSFGTPRMSSLAQMQALGSASRLVYLLLDTNSFLFLGFLNSSGLTHSIALTDRIQPK